MEIHQEEAPAIRPMKSDNAEAESEMAVVLTPQLIRMLSSGVYQNNVRAILREYLCNAYDAQVEAGTLDKEIHLFLPNTIEPYFKIRDFGTGLSEDGIRNIFGAYGNSTKTKTNDQIGCFGIGSKSAFSYTDQFMVVSYYKDTKRTYTCFMENGLPRVRLMTTEDTEEPNGLEISFPVMDPADFKRFVNEAMFVLKPFNAQGVKYKVYGVVSGWEVQDYMKQVQGTNWFVSPDIRNGLVVRMGLVDYVVDHHQLHLDHDVRTIAEKGVCLTLPVGSVQPTPSRENLQIDDVTRKSLQEACDVVAKEMMVKAQEAINQAPNMQAARKTWHELFGGYHAPYYGLNANLKAEWRGRPLTTVVRPRNYGFEVVELAKQPSWSSVGVRCTTIQDMRMLDLNLDKRLVWEDYPSGEFRVKAWLNHFGTRDDVFYLVRPVKSANMHRPGVPRLPRGRDMKRFFEALGVGWKAFRMASSFPKKEREKPVRKNKGPDPGAKIFKLAMGQSGGSAWKAADIDITQGGYYVPIRHWKAQYEVDGVVKTVKPEEFERVMRAVGSFNNPTNPYDYPPVYGVNKDSVVKRMQKEGNWVNLFDHLIQTFWEMAKYTQDEEYWTKIRVRDSLPEFGYYEALMRSGARGRSKTILDFIPGNHEGPITTICHSVHELSTWLETAAPKYSAFTRDVFRSLKLFLLSLGVPGVSECKEGVWKDTRPVMDPDEMAQFIMESRQQYSIPSLIEAYPMLEEVSFFTPYLSQHRPKVLADYVLMVDKFRSCECK